MEVFQHQPISPECRAWMWHKQSQQNLLNVAEKSTFYRLKISQNPSCGTEHTLQVFLPVPQKYCSAQNSAFLLKVAGGAATQNTVFPPLERRKILPDTGDDSMTASSSLLLKTTGVCPCTCLALKTKDILGMWWSASHPHPSFSCHLLPPDPPLLWGWPLSKRRIRMLRQTRTELGQHLGKCLVSMFSSPSAFIQILTGLIRY